MWRDLRFSLRQWRRNKAFATVIILLLGVGIGANTLIFSFIEAALLKPLLVRNPQNLFLVTKIRPGGLPVDIPVQSSFYYSDVKKIQARKDLFSSAIAEEEWARNCFLPLDTGGIVKMVSTQIVSPNYFSNLGVHAILGRELLPSDATASSVPVVISYQFWQSHFNGDRNVVGRKLRLKSYAFRIVGVLPRDFHGIDVDRSPDIRLPISAAPILTGHTVFRPYPNHPLLFQIQARLAPQVTAASAGAAITRVAQMGDAAMIRFFASGSHLPATRLHLIIQRATNYRVALQAIPRGISYARGKFSAALYALMGAVGLLLLAVCANVSGLLLARAERRRQEIAIRAAVGASRTQLLRQFFIENLLLAIPSAGLGILFAYAVSPALLHLLPQIRWPLPMYAAPEIIHVALDKDILGFTIAVALVSIFLFGLGPAWRETSAGVNSDLTGNRQSRRKRISGVLSVAIQVGLGVVLIAGAVLMIRTFWNLEHVNPGFDYAHILNFDLNPQAAGYSDEQARAFLHEVRTEVAAIPGVRSDAYALEGLMRGIGMGEIVTPEGKMLPENTTLNTSVNLVSPGYFHTMGIPLLSGRAFEQADGARKPEPTIVNKAFAEFFFPHQDPIGKGLVGGRNGKRPASSIIVGVVGTANYRSLRKTNPRIIYGPLNNPFGRHREASGVVLCVRTFGNPKAMINEVRGAIHRIDSRVPIVAASTLEQAAQGTLWKTRILTWLAGFFGIIALILTAVGIYGSLAYFVSARTREIGIRLAVGAQQKDILRTVCGRISIAVGCGLLSGLVAAAVLLRLAQSFFFGVQALDLFAFSAAVLSLLLCGAVAASVPTLRAIRTDPARALRTE